MALFSRALSAVKGQPEAPPPRAVPPITLPSTGSEAAAAASPKHPPADGTAAAASASASASASAATAVAAAGGGVPAAASVDVPSPQQAVIGLSNGLSAHRVHRVSLSFAAQHGRVAVSDYDLKNLVKSYLPFDVSAAVTATPTALIIHKNAAYVLQ